MNGRRRLRSALLLGLLAGGLGFAAGAEAPHGLRLEARRASQTIAVDGRLDEADWAAATPITGFVQIEPRHGESASQDTEVRVLFDDRYLYLGFRCHDSAGGAGLRAPDLRRDFDYDNNDFVGVAVDPFGDGRTAQIFYVNPHGAQRDLRSIDGTQHDPDWNVLWLAAAAVEEGGWTAEIALPWSSLRYPAGGERWRVNFLRRLRRDGELSAWVEYPRHYSSYHMRYSGELHGLEPPPPGRQLQASPYGLTRADREGLEGARTTDRGYDFGGEIKWLPGPATTVDATVNTDFAQVEVDRQVVNLSRFSVFFPEKRPFFLENRTLFESRFDDLKPFFSRRIGLDGAGLPVPIDGGVRLIHQDAGQAFGGLVMQTREQGGTPQSRFALGRYSRNFGERHRLGGLVVHRRDEGRSLDNSIDNTVLQLDGIYRPNERFSFQGMVSGSRTSGTDGDGDGFAASVWTYYQNETVYIGLIEHLISERYDPRTGFVIDRNLIVTSPAVTFDLRPAWLPKGVRRIRPNLVSYLYHNQDDRSFREGWVRVAPLWALFENGSEIWVRVEQNWQRLAEPFSPLPGIEVAPGSYDYLRWRVGANSDRSRNVSGEASWIGSDYFDGSLEAWTLGTRIAPLPHTALRLDYQRNELRNLGPERAGRRSELFTPELRLALNPRLQLALFYQHNTAAERDGWNARFVWEWRPLSFIHLVYTRNTPTDPDGGHLLLPELKDEQLILKMTWTGQF